MIFSFSGSILAYSRRKGQRNLVEQGQPQSGQAQEAAQGAHCLHRPPAQLPGAQLRASEVPVCPGPHGAGGLPQPHRHTGQDLVPEPEVKTLLLLLQEGRREGEGEGEEEEGGLISHGWLI